jgi:TonB family protein
MMKKSFLVLAVVGLLCVLGGPTFATEAASAVFDPATDGVSAPQLIPASRVVPSYPPAALQARYDGAVVARAIVNEDGTVGAVEILDSSRQKLGFEKSVISAVKQWRFEPAQREGESVASYAWLRLYFNPPQAGATGFVAADFPESMVQQDNKWVATVRHGASGTSGLLPAGAGPNKSAMSEDQAARFATYGKPPACAKGCVYDRNALIPASTYRHSSPIGGE